jgi:DNA-binding LytR/AlgR family response regulator
MMKVLILEDEHPALERMTELLHLYDKTIEIEATFDSVKDIVLWLDQILNLTLFSWISRLPMDCALIFLTR